MVTGSIGCYKISRFKLAFNCRKRSRIPYLLIGVFAALDADRLGNSLADGVGMVLILIFHARAVLDVRWEVDTLGEGLGGRSVGGLAVGLSIDVFTGNAWDVASIACTQQM